MSVILEQPKQPEQNQSVEGSVVGAVFAFLKGILAVWFLAAGASLYQDRIVY